VGFGIGVSTEQLLSKKVKDKSFDPLSLTHPDIQRHYSLIYRNDEIDTTEVLRLAEESASWWDAYTALILVHEKNYWTVGDVVKKCISIMRRILANSEDEGGDLFGIYIGSWMQSSKQYGLLISFAQRWCRGLSGR